MDKKRSPFLDYTVYIIARIGVCFLQMLSWKMAKKVAELAGWAAYTIDKRHRRVAMENLRRAFPGQYSEFQLDQMVRAVFCHFCHLIIEMVLIPRKLRIHNYKKYIQFVNEKEFLKVLLTDRPVMFLTGHFGNWELAAYHLGLCGITPYGVARTLDNLYLDNYVRQFREHSGQKILAKKGDFDRMNEVLASAGVLGTMVDQDAGKRGLFVDFFGQPASTHKAIALMALEYQVPLIVTGTYKVGEPLRYHVVTEDVIFPEEYANHPDPVRAITERFTQDLERLIRLAPEQYFWLHNRWKHQPSKAKKKAA